MRSAAIRTILPHYVIWFLEIIDFIQVTPANARTSVPGVKKTLFNVLNAKEAFLVELF